MKRAGLAATIKARWICEQAHQQLKEKLGLDHFEGRSWQGLHRHALMTMIAYAFLQHRHLTQVGRKKESTDRRLSLACRPYATPSSISFFDHYLSNAHTAEDEAVKNSGVGKSAKVVLGHCEIQLRTLGVKCGQYRLFKIQSSKAGPRSRPMYSGNRANVERAVVV
jgi:Transposase DDE domain